MFSNRSAHDFRPNALTQALAHARASGRDVLDLTVSNPTAAGIPYAGDAIARAMGDAKGLVYAPEPFGLPTAREAVATMLPARGASIGIDRILLTASTSEAYSFLFKLLADPGDAVLVPQPSYPLFEHLATFEGVRVVPYPLAYDGQWHVDLPALRAAVDVTTRAIVVVSPNNPTGSYLKTDELRAIAALGLPILSDEVFAEYSLHDDPRRASSVLDAAAEASLVFALGGLSKLAALPQMKLAWTAVAGADEHAVAGALSRLELIADTFLSVGTPVQHALPVLLATGATARDAIRARTAVNLARLRALLANKETAATLLDCEGGWYATLRLPRTQSEESWVLSLLEDDAVYVHPGAFFDFREEAYVVVSLLTREAVFDDGISRLLARVDSAR
jgi:aspartate/methionine/tyrosine aminotransferase